MPQGSIELRISTVAGEPLRDKVDIDFEPHPGEPGTSGEHMETEANMGNSTDLTISKVACRGGPGTLYTLTARSKNYCPYSFFQTVIEGRVTSGSDNVEMWVDPSKVKDIAAPKFEDLSAGLQQMLNSARMFVIDSEDADLNGKSGNALYRALGPLRKAALLNIFKKASHKGTSANCARFFRSLMICRQDRCFAMVEPAIADFMRNSELYKSASNLLHQPLNGFERSDSFKTRDGHANLQVTLMRHTESGLLAADIDIDESAGIEHGFEVIRNATFRNRTNPYQIHEFLLIADPVEKTLDPGYSFVF